MYVIKINKNNLQKNYCVALTWSQGVINPLIEQLSNACRTIDTAVTNIRATGF